MNLSPQQQKALEQLRHSNARWVIGVDEVGRGALAGPLVVAGAVFRKGWGHPKVKDSKKFTGPRADKNRRKVLSAHIDPTCEFRFIKSVSHEYIDQYGMGEAIRFLTVEVIKTCSVHYHNSVVVTDGNVGYTCEEAKSIITMPKADRLVPPVSAASIIAKVYRDAKMLEYHEKWPHYGFNKNKGYQTKVHVHGLDTRGPCPIHRLSFSTVEERRHVAKVQAGA